MKRVIALLALTPTLAFAQQRAQEAAPNESDDRWTIGLGVAAQDSPYAGEGTRTTPFPSVGYEGKRWFFRGVQGGFHLVNRDGFQVDALLSGRFDGYDIKDLGRKELAENGVDASLLEDRKHGLDAGVGLSWTGSYGQLRVNALADVTDTSGGFEASADYKYFIQAGKWTLMPGAGVRWMSKDLTQYYYGTWDKEVAKGVVRYTPDAAVVPNVSFAFARPIGERWKLYGGVEYKLLPKELTDSPLLEKDTDGVASVAVGMSYSF